MNARKNPINEALRNVKGVGGMGDMSGGTFSVPDPNKVYFSSGTTSTKQVRLGLIPHRGLVNAAKTFEKGVELHGDKAVNNLREDDKWMHDNKFMIERCSHAIKHCYNLLDYFLGKQHDVNIALGDAGAVAFLGLIAGECLTEEKEEV